MSFNAVIFYRNTTFETHAKIKRPLIKVLLATASAP